MQIISRDLSQRFRQRRFWLVHVEYAVSVFWIVLMINAVNLIDGLDGLAGGVIFFASTMMVVFGVVRGQPGPAMLFGAAYGFGALKTSNELIVIHGSGISLASFAIPIGLGSEGTGDGIRPDRPGCRTIGAPVGTGRGSTITGPARRISA